MKVLVVDDEQPARDRLKQLLEDIPDYDFAGEAGNGNDAVSMAAELKPDIVLLDIRMPGLDGIETAHHLNTMENPPAVVFTTAYDEYAIDAFDARAIGYVLKPVRRTRLAEALEHASRLVPQTLTEVAEESKLPPVGKAVCIGVGRGVGEAGHTIAGGIEGDVVSDQFARCVCQAGGRNPAGSADDSGDVACEETEDFSDLSGIQIEGAQAQIANRVHLGRGEDTAENENVIDNAVEILVVIAAQLDDRF